MNSAPHRPHSMPAENFDHPLEFMIPSRSRPDVVHKCELRAYGRNGECSCEDFDFNMRPHLRRGITAAQALEQKLVKIRKGHRPEDCLRCDHLIEARWQFADDMVKAVDDAERSHDSKDPY